ncbi:amino acid adenylation domain-containing protein [Pseudoalteromonas rubra]|uniref:Amino acid adenylation domain-containing protein n=1 Tax=Pseudoalteromonas rubra TaxID=43658 RepID=A0A5S3UTI2_9GAMM|nr:amino acid adenylation domain-containing protein [Pseudoalteromonas rubra]QPB82378.1 amino acid adenylation domain-containing protein [Pseudoalteromonas rubra]
MNLLNSPNTHQSASGVALAEAEIKAINLIELMRHQVATQPDATAVVGHHESMTFAQLDLRAQQIAATLQQLDAKPDDYIGLFVEPSDDLVVGVWGSLYAGCGYLPLSPEYPDKRVLHMITDSKTQLILTQSHLKEKIISLVGPSVTVICLEELSNEQTYCAEVAPENLAYMIYTSGSTGTPKGVMIEHGNIVNQMRWLRQQFGFNNSTRIIQKTPFSFDAAQWEILACAMGACVVASEPGMYRDPMALIDAMIENEVTVLQCVPTLLQALLDTPGIQLCSSLQHVFSGGETLTKQLAAQFFEELPGLKLTNLYGPTECTINSSSYTVTQSTLEQDFEAISIGQAVANTHYYVLDDELQSVAAGESGELYISGAQIARGYFDRADITKERFISNPHSDEPQHSVLYRSGDVVKLDDQGNAHFLGRVDNQVKLRGYRVELDEIRLAIEKHDWVKNAAMVIKNDERTGFQNLIACIELNKREAAVMDQGNHGEHHQSKKNKLQVKAQLSNAGFRSEAVLKNEPSFELPNKQPTQGQSETVFARKTYRFFEGGELTQQDIVELLATPERAGKSIDVAQLSYGQFGQIMRYFGQFKSEERLLPKYGYASPGALYATQLFVEIHQLFDLDAGIYYYQPEQHTLHLVRPVAERSEAQLKVHFLGKQQAIEPVYKNNILEVLEMETGHMLGLFDQVLPLFGLAVGKGEFTESLQECLAVEHDDQYLGSYEITPAAQGVPLQEVESIVQIQGVEGLENGQYSLQGGEFVPLSEKLIEKKSVIAINQQVYERSSFGVSMLSHTTEAWRHYVDLGRRLQQLQMNKLNIGLMSSGYSSKSGNNLPSADRFGAILAEQGKEMKPFYFCIGGKVSDEQMRSEGMKEDAIHMRGPVEILKDDLQSRLPTYMVPNQIVAFDAFPQTANGKVDYIALRDNEKLSQLGNDVPYIEPRNPLEEHIAEIWKQTLKWDKASVKDNFFESGGNSLTAVTLLNRINKELSLNLPMQTLFQAPSIEDLAQHIQESDHDTDNRLISLNNSSKDSKVFCWPGLGGYPMSLKPLAEKVADQAEFIGVQAHGINEQEVPYQTISEMARADIKLLKEAQPEGPYTLWGYSFGARVAFEVAHQLEQAGDEVKDLYLIAPGSPELPQFASRARVPCFSSGAFVTILYSVFFQKISGPVLEKCLEVVTDKASFIDFVCTNHRALNQDMVKRIVDIVVQTYEFKYTFNELLERNVKAPKVIFKAQGDDYSFLENIPGYAEDETRTIHLEADHYALLKHPGVEELFDCIVDYQSEAEAFNRLLTA